MFLTAGVTAVLLASALAPCAPAQTPSAQGGETVVRERRATARSSKDEQAQKQGATGAAATGDSKDKSKGEAASKVESAKGEAASKNEPSPKSEASSRSAAKSQTDADAGDAAPVDGAATKDEGGLDELRARIATASVGAERARLQHALVERLTESGARAEAVELLRSMLAEERFDPPFFYNVGNALARLGESDAAVEAYRKAVAQRHGNYSRAQHNLGVVLTRLGRWEEAEESLTAALRQESYTYAGASYSLGRLHALRGEAGLAIEEWRRTLRIEPGHAGAAVALARALAEDGDPARALAVLDDFGARLTRRGAAVPREVTVARGEIVAAANVAAEPERERGRSSSEEREAGGGDALQGAKVSASKSESAGAARAPIERESSSALRESRTPSTKLRTLVVGRETYSLLQRAREAREAQRGEEAVALYRRAIESNGGYFAPADLELGFTLASMQRQQEAVASLLVVTDRQPTRYPIAFYHLGRLYEHLGRLEQADAAYARAIELMGDQSPQFFVDLSRVREREGKYVEALRAAEQYVRAMVERAGAAPDWARERVTFLQKKLAASAAQPSKN
jgi:tetratricopeptide (TPR) repeat protein